MTESLFGMNGWQRNNVNDKEDEVTMKQELWNLRYRKDPSWKITKQWNEEEKLYSLQERIENVLDIGCGEGSYLRGWIKKKVFSVGVDISSEAIRQAMADTDPACRHLCRWYVSDWEKDNVVSRGWDKKFDLVYSAMGPDMEAQVSFEKLLSVSKKYCRLVVFKNGENTVVNKVKDFFQRYGVQDSVIMEVTGAAPERLLKKIEAYGYVPQAEDILYRVEWQQSSMEWEEYLSNVHYPNVPKIKIQQALRNIFGFRDSVTSRTCAYYTMITWEVG